MKIGDRIFLMMPESDPTLTSKGACLAFVTYVNEDGTVNLAAFDADGNHFARQNVTIGKGPTHGYYCDELAAKPPPAAEPEAEPEAGPEAESA